MNWSGKRVTVMGLGLFGGNEAAVRFLGRRGALVTVTDIADAVALEAPLRRLSGEPITNLRLGEHRIEDFRNADAVVVNPAVRPDNQFVAEAARRGAAILTEVDLFFQNKPEGIEIVAVTGSNGKSTTAAMIAAIFRAAGRRTHLGGNIGRSLLDALPQMYHSDACVIELSSFQLYWMGGESVRVRSAVVTSFVPNHLDWHGTIDAYRTAKQRLFQFQSAEDWAVFDADDPSLSQWRALVRGKWIRPVSDAAIPPLLVPGKHNRANARLAAATAQAIGCDSSDVRRGLAEFRGLPQRLEWCAVIEGRRIYNDSASTTPESTAAALDALEAPTWLIAGGKDKGCRLELIAEAAVRRAQGAAFFGSCAKRLLCDTQARDRAFPAVAVENAAEALRWCMRRSRPGDTIVFSPGCAGTDQYRNYRCRGEQFTASVAAMAGKGGL